jgi:hypothetical protein
MEASQMMRIAWITTAACGVAAAQTELPQLHSPVTAPLEEAEAVADRFPLLPEGAYIAERLARLRTVGAQASAVVFVRTGAEDLIRPMALLPCSNTQAMEQIAASGSSEILFEVSGQVFASRGVNYFLPMIFRVVSEEEAKKAAPATPVAPTRAPEPEPPLLDERPDEVAVEDLIEELEAATRAAEADRTPDAGRPRTLQREGGIVTLRRGRLVRGGAGGWVFTFDTGADDSPNAEPLDAPMGVMPCRLLDEMEAVASRRGEHVTMTVSGRVFLYDQQNYLLPTMFVVNRSGEGGLTSAQ